MRLIIGICFLICLSHHFWHNICRMERRHIDPGSGQGVHVDSVLYLSPWGCTVPWFWSGNSEKHASMPKGLNWGSGSGSCMGELVPEIFLKSYQAKATSFSGSLLPLAENPVSWSLTKPFIASLFFSFHPYRLLA